MHQGCLQTEMESYSEPFEPELDGTSVGKCGRNRR